MKTDLDKAIACVRSMPQQEITSAATSRKQIPAIFKTIAEKIWPGGRGAINFDFGGGFWLVSSQYLWFQAINNVIFDRFNKTDDENESALSYIQKHGLDTVSCANVLNVIAEANVRAQVIHCVSLFADASREKLAFFSMHYDPKAPNGIGGQVTKEGETWQEMRPSWTYVPELQRSFKYVRCLPGKGASERFHSDLIIASNDARALDEYAPQAFQCVADKDLWTQMRREALELGHAFPAWPKDARSTAYAPPPRGTRAAWVATRLGSKPKKASPRRSRAVGPFFEGLRDPRVIDGTVFAREAARYKAEIKAAPRSLGKHTAEAVYLHQSAVKLLPPFLQAAVKNAAAIAGLGPKDWTIAKLYRTRPIISLLSYPTFFTDGFPALAGGFTVFFDEERARPVPTPGKNPPILHRKEEMLASDHPDQTKFQALTKQAEDAGLFDYDSNKYGYRDVWDAIMKKQGVKLVGHRLVRL